ncbi:hypothetical protein WN55_01469 [Dufourea novaeangliae]|uniref:Uncharacterized protein n=1 Tax=Dufourea novaeangliae TaxID=178035 RepID=A0A154PES8_DUFNO|nr:hypothetical protein WN55_01469 [Dufourea novaeangliae]
MGPGQEPAVDIHMCVQRAAGMVDLTMKKGHPRKKTRLARGAYKRAFHPESHEKIHFLRN